MKSNNNCDECPYKIKLPVSGVWCNAYSKSKRLDGRWWAHWPKCSNENCPIEYPELLEGAILIEEEISK